MKRLPVQVVLTGQVADPDPKVSVSLNVKQRAHTDPALIR